MKLLNQFIDWCTYYVANFIVFLTELFKRKPKEEQSITFNSSDKFNIFKDGQFNRTASYFDGFKYGDNDEIRKILKQMKLEEDNYYKKYHGRKA